MKILTVCLGNICRSPLAEGILRTKLDERYLVDSAGTGAWHVGEAPDSRSIEVARLNGIDISDQRARVFTPEDFESFDLILAMDESNLDNILLVNSSDNYPDKAKTILSFAPELGRNVPDPYHGALSDFHEVFRLLDKATDGLIKSLNL